MFRRICIAYEVLRDPQRKLMYDLTLKAVEMEHQQWSSPLENLRKKAERIQQKYNLMFQELLNENMEAGLRIYEQLQREDKKFCIDNFLSYEDSRDCEFLIAEAYHTLGDYQTAMRIYESLILYEKRRPCFHHFIDEIKERLKRIYFHCLMNPQHIEDIPTDLEKIRALNLSKRETAWVYKKLAEFYLSINWLGQARTLLKMAFELHPQLSGVKKICEKLGMEDLLVQQGKRS
jgi:tetratricopeptide (TPR) repeat protein